MGRCPCRGSYFEALSAGLEGDASAYLCKVAGSAICLLAELGLPKRVGYLVRSSCQLAQHIVYESQVWGLVTVRALTAMVVSRARLLGDYSRQQHGVVVQRQSWRKDMLRELTCAR